MTAAARGAGAPQGRVSSRQENSTMGISVTVKRRIVYNGKTYDSPE